MDFATSALTPGLQMFVTGGIIKTMGRGWTLALIPLLLALICVALSVAPVLWIIVVLQLLRLAVGIAVGRGGIFSR